MWKNKPLICCIYNYYIIPSLLTEIAGRPLLAGTVSVVNSLYRDISTAVEGICVVPVKDVEILWGPVFVVLVANNKELWVVSLDILTAEGVLFLSVCEEDVMKGGKGGGGGGGGGAGGGRTEWDDAMAKLGFSKFWDLISFMNLLPNSNSITPSPARVWIYHTERKD